MSYVNTSTPRIKTTLKKDFFMFYCSNSFIVMRFPHYTKILLFSPLDNYAMVWYNHYVTMYLTIWGRKGFDGDSEAR